MPENRATILPPVPGPVLHDAVQDLEAAQSLEASMAVNWLPARLSGALAVGLVLSASLLADPGQEPADPLARADASFRAGRFAEAADEYRRLVDDTPTNGHAHVGLVQALLRLERVNEALRAAERGVAVVSRFAPLLAAQGDVLFRQGDLTKAFDSYAGAIAADARYARAHLGLGSLDLAERRNAVAKGRFQKAHDLDPRDPDVHLAWASTLAGRQERVAALEEYLRLATNEEPRRLARLRASLAAEKALGDRRLRVIADPQRAYRVALHEMMGPKGPVQAYSLAVVVNGQKLKLILDTGASGILLDRKPGERARLTRLADGMPVSGIGSEGPRPSTIALADKVQVGELEIRGVEVRVFATDLLDDCDGLIGADVFSHFLVQLDFPGATMRLSPPAPGETSIAEDFWGVHRRVRPGFTPVHMFGSHLVADTLINDIPGFLMILDSGSYSHLLSTNAVKKITTVHGADVQVQGISGRASDTLYTNREVRLTFARIAQPGQFLVMDFTEQNRDARLEFSGLIGLDALRLLTMTIDYTNGLVLLEYKER